MFAACAEITNLKARDEGLRKSGADYNQRYEEAKLHRERAEVLEGLQVELEQKLIDKDVVIAELQCRLRKAQEAL
ncbi:hypothetical protein Hanom_Chr14g01301621 [Helianthus anomalus]